MTEIKETERFQKEPAATAPHPVPIEACSGWVYYDADCPLCVRLARRVERMLGQRGLRLVPLQTPGTAARLGITEEALLLEMRLRTVEGTVLGGADAAIEILRRLGWPRLLLKLAELPSSLGILRRLYSYVAAHRYCVSGRCACRPVAHRTGPGRDPAELAAVGSAAWLPLLVFPGALLTLKGFLPAWAFMWALAFGLYAACKWMTFHVARREGARFTAWGALGYLLGWMGMDPEPFTRQAHAPPKPKWSDWARATLVTCLGVGLLYAGPRWLGLDHPLAAGWAGMVGIILALHFGSFQLLALFWRHAGRAVKPLMLEPWRAASVGEFWGRRWNTGFQTLAHRFVFRPVAGWAARRRGELPGKRTRAVTLATLGVFLGSGLIHDLVITVPAGCGYGLPTAYFLLQGLGLVLERRWFGARPDGATSTPWGGRAFTILITAGPAFWLFPPGFVHNVILPMLQAIGAL